MDGKGCARASPSFKQGYCQHRKNLDKSIIPAPTRGTVDVAAARSHPGAAHVHLSSSVVQAHVNAAGISELPEKRRGPRSLERTGHKNPRVFKKPNQQGAALAHPLLIKTRTATFELKGRLPQMPQLPLTSKTLRLVMSTQVGGTVPRSSLWAATMSKGGHARLSVARSSMNPRSTNRQSQQA